MGGRAFFACLAVVAQQRRGTSLMVQATEPTTDVIAPQTVEDEVGQATPAAAAPSGEAVEASGGAAAEGTPGFDLASEEGIARALETIPQLRERLERERKQAQNDGFNAGRQNRDKELRLERGSEETAKAFQRHLLERYGVELDEADQREAPLWVKANRDAERATYWETMTKNVLDAFDVRERAQIEAHLQNFEGLPDQMEQIGRQVVDEAARRTATQQIATLKMTDVPKESALWTDLQQHIAAEVEKEVEARMREAGRNDAPPPPRTPAGTSTNRNRSDYAHLTAEQIAALPDDEYRLAMGYV